MYKFNYPYIDHYDTPIIACLVPDEWLTLELPTFGGAVTYHDKQEQAGTLADFVFEFSEIQIAGKSGRTFTLKIHLLSKPNLMLDDCRDVFNKIIRIHSLADTHIPANEDIPAEVVLLNHLLCCFAGSSFTGESFLDFSDLLQFLASQSDFKLKYAIGIDPDLMLKIILDGLGYIPPASMYPVIFGKSGSVSLALFDKVLTKLCYRIGYAPAVDQDEFLISVLMLNKSAD